MARCSPTVPPKKIKESTKKVAQMMTEAKTQHIELPEELKFTEAAVVRGLKRQSIFEWSLDELIEYKITKNNPVRIFNVDDLYMLGRASVSIKNIAAMAGYAPDELFKNKPLYAAWERGRAEAGTQLRSIILEQALTGNLTAALYLDKILGGDDQKTSIEMTVQTRPLQDIPTENLLTILYNHDDQEFKSDEK
jgi:hypothetical protein